LTELATPQPWRWRSIQLDNIKRALGTTHVVRTDHVNIFGPRGTVSAGQQWQ
jgi:hypothetical protein